MNSADEKIIKTLVEKLELTMNLLGDDAKKNVLVTVADIKNALDLINRQEAEIYDLKSTLSEVAISYDAMRGAANSYKMHYEKAQAEIEILKDFRKDGFFNLLGNCLVYSKNLKDYNDMRKGLKAEGIKEFAERLKRHCYFDHKDQRNTVAEVIIDHYVKEMAEKGGAQE